MTSRAEYRLLLRHDNADLRLTPKGYEIGLISEERYRAFLSKKKAIDVLCDWISRTTVPPAPAVNAYLESCGSARIQSGVTLKDLLKRPELNVADVFNIAGMTGAVENAGSSANSAAVEKAASPEKVFPGESADTDGARSLPARSDISSGEPLPAGLVGFFRLQQYDRIILTPRFMRDVSQEAEILVKYEGYIARQEQQIAQFKKLENMALGDDIDYNAIKTLSLEAREKLSAVKPESIGQAGRISGVTPGDVTALIVYLKTKG